MVYDVVVIGGGPSGMMAAGRAAERGKKVLLLEKNNQLGEKLKITGNGRCNITNVTPDLKLLLKNFDKAEKFLYSSFVQFGVEETIDFFEKRGLVIKVEEQNRAFPQSESASDVVLLMQDYLKNNKVILKTGSNVDDIIIQKNKAIAIIINKKEILAKSIVIATGGLSHPETGSTGDGFLWLKKLGCEVVQPSVAVVPFKIKEKWIKNLSGVAFDNIKVNFYSNQKKAFSKQGRVLCTHFGVSGPLILNSASKVSDLLKQGSVTIGLDLFPEYDHKQFDNYFLNKISENINCSFSTIMKYILPVGTAKEIIKLLNIDPTLKINTLTRGQRIKLIERLKDIRISVDGLMGFDRSVVVDGGLLIKEVDAKSMRLRKYDNIFVTGDVLHIRRPSGGYSLQLCWTTGYVAGSHV